jgi:predicted amidohydrolase
MQAAATLSVTLIQSDIIWEAPEQNRARYEAIIAELPRPQEIVLLPEMFSTGFSMDPKRLAEPMDGPSVSWMRATAAKHRIILAGSLIISEGGLYFNRLIWMQPDGIFHTYDKRHLFGYAQENEHYAPGDTRLIVQVKGWRICPLICYDLRFPVWARNAGPDAEDRVPYDVLLYVANWPERRSLAWKTLLQARAIENQAYCIGVNRVGEDGKGIAYSGDSSVFSPLGEPLWQQSGAAAVHTQVLEWEPLQAARQQFPFLKDADRFVVS